jgi:hypothetical protein
MLAGSQPVAEGSSIAATKAPRSGKIYSDDIDQMSVVQCKYVCPILKIFRIFCKIILAKF